MVEGVMNVGSKLVDSLTDNDTVIILAMSTLAFLAPENRELIAGALLGYLGSKSK